MLVVDDERDVRLLLRIQLESIGYEVVGEAADGIEALERCEETEPEAVVLDLLMPRMSGFDVIPRLRSRHPGIGIVAYTAVAGDFVRAEMTRLRIPLVLKTGQVGPLDAALREVLGTADAG